jgi:3-oxoacyl-[acyl-carrier-protein] synthase III
LILTACCCACVSRRAASVPELPHVGAPYCDRRSMSVLGTGSSFPGAALGSSELLDQVDQTFGLSLGKRGRAVARSIGIRSRHIVRDLCARHEAPRRGDSNAELAARAVQSALTDANRGVADIAYLIAHTATPGTLLPPGVAQVAEHLGYDGPIAELRQACTGFANALVFAASVAAGQSNGVVVIVGSETGSVFFDPLRAAEDDGQLINMLQMGDGAGAIVIGAGEMPTADISCHYAGQIGRGRPPAFSLSCGGSDQLATPDTHAEFIHNFAAIRRDGEQLFRAGIVAAQSMGIELHSVDWIIPHQANGHMDEMLATALNFPRERIFVNASRIGNTGSAAIWLALNELRQQLKPGERVLVLGAEATKFLYGGFLYVHR